MNLKRADKLKWNAKRTIRIIDFILAGETDGDIVLKVPGAERNLIKYYRSRLELED